MFVIGMRLNDKIYTAAVLVFLSLLLSLATEPLCLDRLFYEGVQLLSHTAGGVARTTSLPVAAILCVFLAVLPLLWLPKLTPIQSLAANLLYLISVTGILLVGVLVFRVWIPPLGALLPILLAYPMWRWRRLDSAQLFLDRELQNLRDELAALGMEQEEENAAANEDPLQSRISRVQLTAKHLRDLHQSRSDTLTFISHDIRAPLGAAMLLLDKFEHNKYTERMGKMITRAYAMAEGFLQASRAEMINVNKFQELDIVSLIQQAVDDVYELSLIKQLKLSTRLPEDPLWVRGDFGLLLRAISNVLLNAVKYSPEQSELKVLLASDENSVELKVIDQGPGIPAKKITKIFKRFSRADGEHQAQEGSGLGLYFVSVTLRKHRGRITASSVEGHGATFVITLPLERRKANSPVENERRALIPTMFSDSI
jgi:signal transduction histidine kinase